MIQTLALLLMVSAAPTSATDITEISKALDDLYRSGSSHSRLQMSVKTPHYQRTLEMEIWTRNRDRSLVRILSPVKERGIATLRRGPELWNYLPKIGKTMRIPPSMMMSSWMGSDMTNDDLVRESSWANDYAGKEVEAPNGQRCLDFQRKPDAAVAWERVRACLTSADLVPISMTYFDEKDRAVRRMTFSDVKEIAGRKVPMKMVLTPLLKKDRQTVIVYQSLKFDVDLPEETFSLATLRRKR